MIDEAFWYQANLQCQRSCEAWSKEVTWQKALRALIPAQRLGLEKQTKAQLAELLKDRGAELRRFARASTKAALVEWIIQDRLATIGAEIARLEKQIADNQPDPRWRERGEEQTHAATE